MKEKLGYNLNREATKISSSDIIDKYEYLTDVEILPPDFIWMKCIKSYFHCIDQRKLKKKNSLNQYKTDTVFIISENRHLIHRK